jgi:stage V sporulation protein AE
MLFAGVVLGAVGVYQPFADWAGAGATVPLTGFGNNLAKGVRLAVNKDGIIGALLSADSPRRRVRSCRGCVFWGYCGSGF